MAYCPIQYILHNTNFLKENNQIRDTFFACRLKDLTGVGLMQDFFKNDPFMDLFGGGGGGGGLFGEPAKDRQPRYSASKYRPRSKSLFRYFRYIVLFH